MEREISTLLESHHYAASNQDAIDDYGINAFDFEIIGFEPKTTHGIAIGINPTCFPGKKVNSLQFPNLSSKLTNAAKEYYTRFFNNLPCPEWGSYEVYGVYYRDSTYFPQFRINADGEVHPFESKKY